MVRVSKAVEVSLDGDGEDAFLRLAKGLPVFVAELRAVATEVEKVATDLVVIPEVVGVGSDGSVGELIADLATVSKSVLDGESRGIVEVALAKLRSFSAWRGGEGAVAKGDPERKEQVGVFLRVPPRVATKFPAKSEDPSPVHSTLLMVGSCTRDEFEKVVDAVSSVAMAAEPFGVELTDYGEFANAEGTGIPHMIPRSADASFEDLHKKLRAGVAAALGREPDHYDGPFKPHITLGYVPKGEKYDGPRPTGKWKAKSVEVWGDRGGEFGRHVVELGSGAVVKTISANKAGDPLWPAASIDEQRRLADSPPAARKDAGGVPTGGDLSTGDLARAGAIAPAQGAKKPKKLVKGEEAIARGEEPKKRKVDPLGNGEIGGEPGKLYPSDDLSQKLPFVTVEAEGIADVALSASGVPYPKKKPDGKHLFGDSPTPVDEGDAGPAAAGGGSSGGVGMSKLARSQAEVEDFGPLLSIVKRAGDDASEEEQRTVLGVVLEPETVDSQGDIYSAEEIERSADKFLERYQQFGLMHRTRVAGILPLQSWISPCDCTIGGQAVKAGTWLLKVRVLDDAIWGKIKAGELTGFSIGGSALRRSIKRKGDGSS